MQLTYLSHSLIPTSIRLQMSNSPSCKRDTQRKIPPSLDYNRHSRRLSYTACCHKMSSECSQPSLSASQRLSGCQRSGGHPDTLSVSLIAELSVRPQTERVMFQEMSPRSFLKPADGHVLRRN